MRSEGAAAVRVRPRAELNCILKGYRTTLGTFTARLGVSNGNGGPTEWVDAVVDTGATFTVLPESLCLRLGLQPKTHLEFTFADGRRKTLPVGSAYLYTNGRENYSSVVFGDRKVNTCVGATALQELVLIADTTNHKLIPSPKLLI